MLPLLSGIVHPFEEQSPAWGLSLYLHMGRPGPSSRTSLLTVQVHVYHSILSTYILCTFIPQYTVYLCTYCI